MQNPNRSRSGDALAATARKSLAKLVADRGERTTLEALRISRHVLYRALAGLPLRRGSALLVERALAAFETARGAS